MAAMGAFPMQIFIVCHGFIGLVSGHRFNKRLSFVPVMEKTVTAHSG